MFGKHLKKIVEGIADSSQRSVIDHYKIAELPISVRYWSDDVQLLYSKAFAHLKDPASSAEPFFTLYVFPSDIFDAGNCMVSARKKLLDEVAQKFNYGEDHQTNLHTKCFDDYFYILDHANNYAIWVFNSSIGVHPWYRVSPFLPVLQNFLGLHSRQIVHAAAIANDHCSIIMTGFSGAGKSTTTLSAIQNGYRYIAEDYCILYFHNQKLTVHSLYSAFKVTPQTPEHLTKIFSNKDPLILERPGYFKKAFFFSDCESIQISNTAAVKGICSLSITNSAEVSMIPQNQHETLKSLAFSTIQQSPSYANQTLKNCYEFTKNTPCYKFNLSRDFEQNINTIGSLFNELSSQN